MVLRPATSILVVRAVKVRELGGADKVPDTGVL